jgi:hypothetical protein
MKRMIFFSLALVLTADLLVLPLLCAQKIDVKTVDGVQIISNPKKPASVKGIPTKLTLKEDLALGGSGETAEMFSEITAFAVDKDENIYIVDRKEHQVRVFDRAGKLIRSFGKQGQGPGEFNQPVGIHLTPNNELMIEDGLNRRLALFTPEGKFLKNISLGKTLGLLNIYLDSKGNIIGRELSTADQKFMWQVKKYDRDLNPLFTIDAVEFQNPLAGKINPFLHMFVYTLGGKDTIIYGNPKQYEIKIFSPVGKLMKKILKDYDPVEISEEDKKEGLAKIPESGIGLKERLEIPKYYPAYVNFTLDEEGRMFVRTYKKGKTKKEHFFDVFDADGRYIAEIRLNIDPGLWKNKKLYGQDETEDGYNVLKRFRVTWE